MSPLVHRAALALLNHMLLGEPWARQRLSPFAEQQIALELGTQRWLMSITPAGLLSTHPRPPLAAGATSIPP
ncbi:MAG: hypothetical protein V4623_07425, partial [Pseudomonadota bacterium]